MKRLFFLLLGLLLIIPVFLAAEDATIDLSSLLPGNFLTQNDSLTNSLTVFGHVNWSQAGAGLSYKHIILMFNKTVLPVKKNYKSDMSASNVDFANIDSYKINIEYYNLMVGYLIRLGKNFYPYIALGTATGTDMIEVHDADESPDVYTVKGKEVTYGTGSAGFFTRYKKHIILEGSMQYKPLLPFVGIGYVF